MTKNADPSAPPGNGDAAQTRWRRLLRGRVWMRLLRWGWQVFRLLLILALGDLAGFVWFAATLPPPADTTKQSADGIVVLTGGSLRVATGLRLLGEGAGRRLLISGVNHEVVLPEILAQSGRLPPNLVAKIDLDYRAGDTYGNAAETAAWVDRQGFQSIILVTAAYHMPRALLELRGRLAGVTIIPHPVHPPGFGGSHWWQREESLLLVAAEYHKALGAWLRQVVWLGRPAAHPGEN